MNAARKAAFTAATVNAVHTQGTHGFFTRLAAVPRMIRDSLNGTYQGLSRGKLFAMLLAVAYLLSPIDLVPEALLTIPGLFDDAAIAIWLLAATLSSAEDYLDDADVRTPVRVTTTVIDAA
jgi:uncharacterized membrane protein YkvA (DUF1232 family)